MRLKIGELARHAGLSVRTLHHYHAIGLLCPTSRTPGGARLYGQQDLCRLQHIQVLKQLGYSLADIAPLLAGEEQDLRARFDRQAEQLEAQARRAQSLSSTLRHLSSRLADGAPMAAGAWLNLLELTALYAQHLSADEVDRLRTPAGGDVAGVEAERDHLVSTARACMRRGVAPDAAEARALAWRWVHMVIALTRNDAVLADKLRSLQTHNRRAQALVGIDAELLAWIDAAIVHARVKVFARYLSKAQAAVLLARQREHAHHWPPLVAAVRAQLDAGAPCDGQAMRALAARWHQLFMASHGGDDPMMLARVQRALAQEPRLCLGVGVDDALMRYVREAQAALPTWAAA